MSGQSKWPSEISAEIFRNLPYTRIDTYIDFIVKTQNKMKTSMSKEITACLTRLEQSIGKEEEEFELEPCKDTKDVQLVNYAADATSVELVANVSGYGYKGFGRFFGSLADFGGFRGGSARFVKGVVKRLVENLINATLAIYIQWSPRPDGTQSTFMLYWLTPGMRKHVKVHNSFVTAVIRTFKQELSKTFTVDAIKRVTKKIAVMIDEACMVTDTNNSGELKSDVWKHVVISGRAGQRQPSQVKYMNLDMRFGV